MKANKENHYCEYEVLSEELNLVACTYCGQDPEVGA